MHLTFKAELFGISNSSIPTGRNEDCLPSFHDGDWIWDVKLGNCGMKISDFEKRHEKYLFFSFLHFAVFWVYRAFVSGLPKNNGHLEMILELKDVGIPDHLFWKNECYY